MKLSNTSTDKQGRAIARGIAIEQAQKERNTLKAERRKQTMLENAAEKALSGGVH